MSHSQDVQCRSGRIETLHIATLPFLTRVLRRCSGVIQTPAPLSAIALSWGTECILFRPTTLGPIVHLQCLLAPP